MLASSEVNARLLGRNDVVRTLANSRFALTAHIIRREVQPRIESTFDNVLCRELDERYDAALSKRAGGRRSKRDKQVVA